MGSYQLIREKNKDPEQGNMQVQTEANNFIITSDGTKDNVNMELSFQKFTAGSCRLISLDIFRGLTVALMILVEYAGGIYPSVNHSPWNGLTLADFVMPFFLFIVGMSLGLAYKNLPCRPTATRKAIYRALKLFIIGLFLQGGYFHGFGNLTYGVDVQNIRIMGILQRIAISFLVAAMCEIWLQATNYKVNPGGQYSLLKRYHLQWAVTIIITVVYLSLFYGLYVPDWAYQMPTETLSVKCGVRGDTGPACNAVGMMDRKILGIRHLYMRPIYGRLKECSVNSPDYGPLPPDAPSWCQAQFDPEVLGAICEHCFGMHLNKALYSFSYMCVTAGAAGFLFTAVYVMVDLWGCTKYWTIVLKWMGTNALLIYVLVSCNILPVILQGFYWRRPENNILNGSNWST
ncbi:hypothetical protein HAX54_029982 [Datura stramonium]|uniref:Heparan-alpha-glucosaminide N-acetyltransferase catalytic domain-containing protein n=1 Tax=Datura stramonium TaxID=4076 RepID=A0ABS8SAN9_DATST|nr:hypothetical protein [Datura stramonium]